MNKKFYICFISFFFILCIIPSLGMIIFGASESAANEILTPLPSVTTPDGKINTSIMSDFSNYINDRFAFRQELITSHSKITSKVFNVSVNDKVTLGQKNWLFYSDTLDDYLNTNVLSDREIFSIAHNLSLIEEYANSKDAKFVFTIAPNKNSIYPEFMPNVGKPVSNEGNMEKLTNMLTKESVSYLDLCSVFKETSLTAPVDVSSDMKDSSGNILLYQRLDSHWNNLGASIAHDELLTYLYKKDFQKMSGTSYSVEKTFDGDLYKMLFPSGSEKDYNIKFDYEPSFVYKDNKTAPDSITIKTERADKSGSLLMFRDSFGNALYPFMADSFGLSHFTRKTPYDMMLMDDLNADTVIIETVERNIPELLKNTVVFPAPRRSVNIPDKKEPLIKVNMDIPQTDQEADADSTSGNANVNDEDTGEGDYLLFSGSILENDTKSIDADSEIFLIFYSDVFEASLSGLSFSAYIPKDLDSEFTGFIIGKVNGEYVLISAS